jgi:hypothetical protein
MSTCAHCGIVRVHITLFSVYGAASKAVLRKLDPIHHRAVTLALRTLAVFKTKQQHKTGIRILTNENHTTRSQMINRNIYNDYAMKPGSPKLFFIRAAELLGKIDIYGRKVKKTPDYLRPPWYTDDGKSMDWSLCKMRKRTLNEIVRAEFQELVNEKYNDGSKKEEKVGQPISNQHEDG